MKRLLLIATLLLLTACGGGGGGGSGGGSGGSSATIAPGEVCRTDFECEMIDRLYADNRVDAVTPRYGIAVRWEWTVPVQQRFDLELIDNAVDELNLCLPEPVDTSMIYLVLGAPEFIVGAWGQPSGLNVSNSNDVIVSAPNYDPAVLPLPEYGYDGDGIYYTLETIKHEFIHVYLFQTGFPNLLNGSHQSDLFPECSDLPWRTGDGVPVLGRD